MYVKLIVHCFYDFRTMCPAMAATIEGPTIGVHMQTHWIK